VNDSAAEHDEANNLSAGHLWDVLPMPPAPWITSVDTSDGFRQYTVSTTITIVVQEQNGTMGLQGTVSIYSSALAVPVTGTLLDTGGGYYEYDWLTSGLPLASDYWVEATLTDQWSRSDTSSIVSPAIELVANPGDSDSDGLLDADEITQGTDPNDPDSDNDGLFDGQEVYDTLTNPNNPDTDGDGWPDGVEVSFGTDPNDPFDFPGSFFLPPGCSGAGAGPGGPGGAALALLAVATAVLIAGRAARKLRRKTAAAAAGAGRRRSPDRKTRRSGCRRARRPPRIPGRAFVLSAG
jgi:hypothetical protein